MRSGGKSNSSAILHVKIHSLNIIKLPSGIDMRNILKCEIALINYEMIVNMSERFRFMRIDDARDGK